MLNREKWIPCISCKRPRGLVSFLVQMGKYCILKMVEIVLLLTSLNLPLPQLWQTPVVHIQLHSRPYQNRQKLQVHNCTSSYVTLIQCHLYVGITEHIPVLLYTTYRSHLYRLEVKYMLFDVWDAVLTVNVYNDLFFLFLVSLDLLNLYFLLKLIGSQDLVTVGIFVFHR